MSQLSLDQINAEMENVPNWQLLENSEIRTTVELKNFKEAMFLVNAIAFEAEKLNHHPDIAVSWNRVELRLTTHDAGGLTDKDFSLAKTIDSLILS